MLRGSEKSFRTLSDLVAHYTSPFQRDIKCMLVREADDVQASISSDITTASTVSIVRASPHVGRLNGISKGASWREGEVMAWVVQQGFTDYVPHFDFNKIDGPTLLDLDDAALQDMGIDVSALILLTHSLTRSFRMWTTALASLQPSRTSINLRG